MVTTVFFFISVSSNPNSLKLPNEFYYYNNTCNDSPENLQEIRENFVKSLNVSAYKAACVGFSDCRAEYSKISCGTVSKRRKREYHIQHRDYRDIGENAYIIKFYLVLPYVREDGKSDEELFYTAEGILYAMVDVITAESVAGNFSIPGLEVRADSLASGYPEYECPLGTRTKQSASCGTSFFQLV